MMEKEFIPYEQALALKELGFDKKCYGHYTSEGDLNTIEDYAKYGADIRQMMNKRFNSESYMKEVCSAPLYQQAFRWLLILVNKNKHFSNKWAISYNADYYSLFLGGCNMGVFKAELECLKKLIEIVKQK